MIQKITKKNNVEAFNLILGLAGPYGAGSTSLAEELERVISDWPGCHVEKIYVAGLIKDYYQLVSEKTLKVPDEENPKRREILQTAGTELRKYDPFFIGEVIASEICKRGSELEKNGQLGGIGTVVFIVDSLKNSKEVEILRRSYSDEFYLIFLHADRETRWRRMCDYKSWKEEDRVEFDKRDGIDQNEKFFDPEVKDAGQQVGILSSLADYYIVNEQNREKLQQEGQRFLELLFGDSTNQPTFHEHNMHLAYSASNRSYCLSRQVGAVIVDNHGEILGVGHNDVPKAFGGLYTEGDEEDSRCYQVGDRFCINDLNKQERFNELTENIKKNLDLKRDEVIKLRRIIEESPFREATEYCRSVHAEMVALLGLYRQHRETDQTIMYATTQPCHNCTKHILCAGIRKVVFIEPYPKSLAIELHSDAIEFGSGKEDLSDKKVLFIPYEGVAPHRFHDFFAIHTDRKDHEGKFLQRSKEQQAINPRFSRHLCRRSRTMDPPDPNDSITPFELNCLSIITKLIEEKTAET